MRSALAAPALGVNNLMKFYHPKFIELAAFLAVGICIGSLYIAKQLDSPIFAVSVGLIVMISTWSKRKETSVLGTICFMSIFTTTIGMCWAYYRYFMQ